MCLKKEADDFFRSFGLTDVQFNLLMLLKHQDKDNKGINQAHLSTMMLVNRANITSLIDRMEKAHLVIRTPDPDDRRSHLIKMTDKGRDQLMRVEPLYAEKVKAVMADFGENEQYMLIKMLEKIRRRIKEKSFVEYRDALIGA